MLHERPAVDQEAVEDLLRGGGRWLNGSIPGYCEHDLKGGLMPEVRVGRNIWGPAIHVIQDSGMSVCGRPASQFVEPKKKTKKPEPCATCFSLAPTYRIDMDWLIGEINGVRSLYA